MYKIGDKVRIVSRNENYIKYMGQDLIITHIATNKNNHQGYDDSMGGEQLLDLRTKDGEEVPFSLYEYEVN